MSLDLVFALGVVATRLLQILAGVLLSVLGYRLFERVPSSPGQAEITLSQHFKLNLSRLGPGVFFALFGAAVLVQALLSPLRLERETGAANAETRERVVIAGARSADATSHAASVPTLSADVLTQHMRFLNGLAAQRQSGLPMEQQVAFELGQREAKLALMQAGWNADWKDAAAFTAWARGERPAAAPDAQAIALWNAR